MHPSLLTDEAGRLAALHQYDIMDTLAEPEFDALARLAATICRVPIALINLIDEQRQWSKAQVGVPLPELSRVDAFCTATIATPDPLIVPDLRADPRFASSAIVVDEPHVRFYAGAPLMTSQGYALGALCVLDQVPRDLDAEQQEALEDLAGQVITQLELRRTIRLLQQANAARARAEAAARLRIHAIEAATSGIVIADVSQDDLPLIYANPAFLRLTGYAEHEIIGRNCRFLQGPATAPATVDRLRQALREARPVTVRLLNYRKDGSTFWQDLSLSPVHDDQGVLTHFVGVQADVTVEERAIQDLRHSEEYFHALIDHSLDLVVLIDQHGCITYESPSAERITGRAAVDRHGQTIFDFMHPDDQPAVRQAFSRLMHDPREIVAVEFRIRHTDGSWRTIEAIARNLLAVPSVAGLVVNARDVTERVHLQQALVQHNEVLEQRVRERTRELEDAGLEILQRLSLAGDFRDDDTGEHVQRVGSMAARLAQDLGLPAEEVALIRLAAPLHDVGKIGIPDRCLLKPGSLTAEEFALMKTHTRIGGGMLVGSHFAVLNLAEEIALTHHERWDGSGYPRGLRGEEIPLVGRITAVADVFDALTHARPYKPAWPVERAVSAITQDSGAHFDPRVVEAFLRLLAAEPAAQDPAPPLHTLAISQALQDTATPDL